MTLRQFLQVVCQYQNIYVNHVKDNNKCIYTGILYEMINDEYQEYYVYDVRCNDNGLMIIFITEDEPA